MTDTTLEVADVGTGPGAMLRKSREARGLEIPAVAAMLHLSEAKLKALEEDDFDKLPEPVFVRGYLRNYARLLEQPEATVLDAYSRFQPSVEISEQPPLDSHVAEEVNSNHGVVKLVSIVIGVILITLPLIWWWDHLEQAAQKIVGSSAPESEQSVADPETSKAEAELAQFIPPPPPGSSESENAPELKDVPEPGSSTEPEPMPEAPAPVAAATEPEPAAEPVPEPAPAPAVETTPAPVAGGSVIIPIPPKAQEVIEKAKPVVEEKVASVKLPPVVEKEVKPRIKAVIRKPKPAPVTKAKPVPEPVSAPAPTPKPKPAVASTTTVFEFVESSWVKVRDASNQVILIGEYKKGEKKRLSGRTPYKVVLGNSPAVRVSVNGKVANLDKFSSGGVARFTISDGKILNP